jgi:hypothetical protein
MWLGGLINTLKVACGRIDETVEPTLLTGCTRAETSVLRQYSLSATPQSGRQPVGRLFYFIPAALPPAVAPSRVPCPPPSLSALLAALLSPILVILLIPSYQNTLPCSIRCWGTYFFHSRTIFDTGTPSACCCPPNPCHPTYKEVAVTPSSFFSNWPLLF